MLVLPYDCSSHEYSKNIGDTKKPKARQDSEVDSNNPLVDPPQNQEAQLNNTGQVKQVQWTEEVEEPPKISSEATEGAPGDPLTASAEEQKETDQQAMDFEDLKFDDMLNQKEGSHVKYRKNVFRPLFQKQNKKTTFPSSSSPFPPSRIFGGLDELLLQGLLCGAIRGPEEELRGQ